VEIQIKTNQRDLFYNLLTYLNPIIPLKETDRKVLSAFLTLHYKYRAYPLKTLNDLLFSEDIKIDMAKRLNLTYSQYSKAFKHLEDKGLIINNSLHPNLTKYPKDGNFKLNISFKVEEWKK
jgi:DNA-binding MarR family transcriptional regulator